MAFFSRSVMNGATFFGVGLTLLALSFLPNINGFTTLILAVVGYVYFVAAFVAFVFPKLSEK